MKIIVEFKGKLPSGMDIYDLECYVMDAVQNHMKVFNPVDPFGRLNSDEFTTSIPLEKGGESLEFIDTIINSSRYDLPTGDAKFSVSRKADSGDKKK